jgi:hypothetical protein
MFSIFSKINLIDFRSVVLLPKKILHLHLYEYSSPTSRIFSMNSIGTTIYSIMTCKTFFFLMRLSFTFLVLLTLKIIGLGQHIIPTMLMRCHCIQLKLEFGLKCPEDELLAQTSLLTLLTPKNTKGFFSHNKPIE